MPNPALLHTSSLIYHLLRPVVFTRSAQHTHEMILGWLHRLDDNEAAQAILEQVYKLAFPVQPVMVGGVELPHPFILAAGFVKGDGFRDEGEALTAVEMRRNIIPGWRTMPTLLGPVEFGSYTRWPRLGNPGTVIWRHAATYSTQNRVGLKNPGARAAAAFLARQALPPVFGVNIAISPGVNDPDQEEREILESLGAFLSAHVYPSWFTLNLSCPNTEDDPTGNQTEAKARRLCGAAVAYLAQHSVRIPLWVKLSPALAEGQYAALMQVFYEVGVQAVIATNTLPRPTPDDPTINAGIGGGLLHPHALHAAEMLSKQYPIDVIGCGGVVDPAGYLAFKEMGVRAVQYWSALVYHGPLVAARILNEVN